MWQGNGEEGEKSVVGKRREGGRERREKWRETCDRKTEGKKGKVAGNWKESLRENRGKV